MSMSMFPVIITKYSGRAESSSGGKDYHLVMIANATGQFIVINRWGKKGQWGTGWSCSPYESKFEAESAWTKKFKEKMDGIYSEKLINTKKSCINLTELKKELGMYWGKIGSTNLGYIGVPEVEAASSRAQESVEWEGSERTGFRPKAKKPLMIEEAKPTIDEEVARDPNWGLF